MLHKTRGIVFGSSKYGETSLVVRIYTELFGIQSYIINSVRKKHAKVHSNIFQPLTPVDMVVYHKERPGLQRISDIRPNPPLANLHNDIFKSSMVFFLNEVLYKTIREEESNPTLFEFIYSSVLHLDHEETSTEFHLLFLLQLSRHLGFAPNNNFSVSHSYFNLMEGFYQADSPPHPHFISLPESEYFSRLIDGDYSDSIEIPLLIRRKLITFVLEFFELHISGFGTVKSHKILEQVWED